MKRYSIGMASSCWASLIGGCDQKISREHLVSQSLFSQYEQVMVQGFHWCSNEPKSIGMASLVTKILCKKHNSVLSEVDAAALHAFNVFRESIRLDGVRKQTKRPPLWNVKHFEIDGPRLERWFLKTLINLSFGSEWTIGPGSQRTGTPSRELVETAFGARRFDNGSGLYIAGYAGQQIDSMDRVNFTAVTEGKTLVAGQFNFRGYTFFLNLLPQKFKMLRHSHLLHQRATLMWNVQDMLSHRIEIKGWAEELSSAL